jgi:hypothetical protein
MSYLLIAYKPDSYDYCRGCLMDSYSSDFQQSQHEDRAKLIEQAAELDAYETRSGEEGYSVTIYADGERMELLRSGLDRRPFAWRARRKRNWRGRGRPAVRGEP